MDVAGSFFTAVIVVSVAAIWQTVLTRRAAASAAARSRTLPPAPEPPAPQSGLPAIHHLIQPLLPALTDAAVAADIEDHPALIATAQAMLASGQDDRQLLEYAHGVHAGLRCAALRAIAERGADFTLGDRLVAEAAFQPPWFLPLALRAVAAWAPAERRVVGEILMQLCVDAEAGNWITMPVMVESLRDFVAARRDRGEVLAFTAAQVSLLVKQDADGAMRQVLARLGSDVTADLASSLASAGSGAGTSPAAKGPAAPENGVQLATLGRVWDSVPTIAGRQLLEFPTLTRHVARMLQGLEAEIPRSCLLVGDPGVGKRTMVEVLGKRLLARNWQILEAGHTEIIADQKYIGQFEGRLQAYARALSAARRLWFVPEFGALRTTGMHDHSATGALHLLRPWLERGELRIVGTLTPSAFEKLAQQHPWVRNVMDIIRVEPLDGPQSLALARSLLAETGAPQPENDRVLDEAWLLAEQFLSDRAAPGNLLQLLGRTRRRLAQDGGRNQFGRADLVTTVAELSGLPAVLLDDRQNFDLGAVRTFFGERILGQVEAVECLVQRIAMIKAGLTDATRPQGVFLFAGPTGTGKTEIAKVLAEYLFGSPARLIRIDMSEFNVPGSATRLLRTGSEFMESGRSLVSRVRQQPFSVVLLDEFEKSARDVWDLFLQVADDGRLTDDNGDTVDFRHTTIILTSNVGALVPTDAGVGFGRSAENFRTADVEKAVAATFRKEFVNRLDRVVIFKPFTREVMRELLQLEIRRASRRRGLRYRDWAPIWDDSAIDFLLERGFTADLGARPLRRAVERYLLEPLAELMAQGRAPSGEQFLFVHAGADRLVTEFVDPDAPESSRDDDGADPPSPSPEDWTPQQALLDPRGGARELAALRARFRLLADQVQSPTWLARKEAALAAMTRDDFWGEDGRFEVLGAVEYIDRLESGVANAGVLLEKLLELPRAADERQPARFAPRELVAKLAGSLFLLERATGALERGEPWEAYLLVDAGVEGGPRNPEADAWARRVAAMYETWARQRRMRREVLRETGGRDGEPWRQISAISGFAAYDLLADEGGLHVWEEPDPRREGVFQRTQVLVQVVPQPSRPAATTLEASREAARLLAEPGAHHLRLVRHYREAPSALVRDRLRGWRTGRLERVLGGDFDLMSAVR